MIYYYRCAYCETHIVSKEIPKFCPVCLEKEALEQITKKTFDNW